MQYRIKDLQNFVVAGENRTISEAARVLGITQPALSESLKRLELDLGRTLLFRTRQGIALSPEGRQILIRAQGALRGLELIDPDHIPTIRIGAHSVIAAWSVPKMMTYFSAREIPLRFEIAHGLSREIQNQIQTGAIDLGLVVNPLPAPGLVSKCVATDDVSVWRAARLKSPRFLFVDPHLLQTQSLLRKWKSRPEVQVVPSSSLEFIAEMIRTGAGWGIVPDKALGADTKAKLRKVTGAPTFRDEIHLVHQPSFGRTSYERAFLDALRNV